ncbi:MAG: biotin carboxylase N-terminal domain-containing protein [Pseudomonadota bacterium]
MTLNKVLIANRGEIARRIIRTARRLGMASVAVYSDADRHALHVQDADQAVHIGPSPSVDSYLRIDKILDAARETGADCVHPGYGFLAENAVFADAVADAGLTFVGPTGKAMRALGDKASAKTVALAANVPVVPGYNGSDQAPSTLLEESKRIGFPVMIKAVAGGGGRGMRRVSRAEDFADALESAQREAAAAFGSDLVLIEKLIEAPRHIEVQVFGDRHGSAIHLFERDCTLQRRNQKVIEEAPAPDMSEALRSAICGAAVRLAENVGYEGAGTVEFLVEGGALTAEAPWYFIEMNTRLQVEHPVTEAITGLDLVEWQFRVAAGEPLPLPQDKVTRRGHAIEARICAEDPAHGFQPQSGKLLDFDVPSGADIRLESGVVAGSVIPPDYDSLIAKLIVSGPDRETVLARLLEVLADTVVLGPRTNTAFLHALLSTAEVQSATMDTGLIDRAMDELVPREPDLASAVQGVLALLADRSHAAQTGPWFAGDGFQLGAPRDLRLPILIDDIPHVAQARWGDDGLTVTIADLSTSASEPSADGTTRMRVRDGAAYVSRGGRQSIMAWPQHVVTADDDDGDDTVRAPISGRVAKLFVTPGAVVAAGDRVAIVEAMKMEHVLTSARAGTVGDVPVGEGDQIAQGQTIIVLAADEELA